MKTLRVATDVGGTFTDLVAFESGPDGVRISSAKSDTTPPDYETGVIKVLVDTWPHPIRLMRRGHQPPPCACC